MFHLRGDKEGVAPAGTVSPLDILVLEPDSGPELMCLQSSGPGAISRWRLMVRQEGTKKITVGLDSIEFRW